MENLNSERRRALEANIQCCYPRGISAGDANLRREQNPA
jgi:hypothetical protein